MGVNTLLVKVELILSHKWAHPKNVTCQISPGKQYVHGNCTGHDDGSVEPAWQLGNVRVELMDPDALAFLEHVCGVVSLLLSHVVGKHCEKVEHHIVTE
jgi:hypothetical protein